MGLPAVHGWAARWPARGPGRPLGFLERTQPHLVFGATVRAAEIIGRLLDADDHRDLTGVGVDR